MSVVLAAIDNSAVARPVLDVALELAQLFCASVEVVHVEETGAPRTAEEMARDLHLPFHGRRGNVAATIAATAKDRDASAVVLGARGVPSGASPAGQVTVELVQMLDIAIAVVPPEADPRALARVLVAVEGDGESQALRQLFAALRQRPDVELVALHVFEPDRLPMFSDQPLLETEAWVEQFGRRVVPATEREVQLEVRVGNAGRALRAAARELDVGLVVLEWHGSLTDGHGRLVRSMLAESELPVLLLPAGSP
jgi:nucleotide-binding universal stress UspA family protein